MATDIDLSSVAIPAIPLADDRHYEIVDGRRVDPPPMSTVETVIAGRVHHRLAGYLDTHPIGLVVSETLFHLPSGLGDRKRRPDVAYVSDDRWPLDRPIERTASWDVVPDLAVEIISPTDYDDDVHAKLDEYFAAGVRQVWHVRAVIRRVYVYRSPTQVEIVDRAGEVVADPLLTGFRMSVEELFRRIAT